MSRRLTGALLALLVLGLAAAAAPQIEVDSDTYDFGSILEGFAIEHTFVLTNTGDETLVIDQVRATCGCTTTGLATNELQPGQSVELDAVVGTTGFGGSTISKSIYVYSNDPEYSDGFGPDKLVLRITGTVVRAEPYRITTEDLYLDSYLLVDLRPAAEYSTGHILGAINIVPSELKTELASFELPESAIVFMYDETGSGTKAIAEGLAAAGTFAMSLNGGLSQWVLGYDDSYIIPQGAELELDAPVLVPSRSANVLDTALLREYLHVIIDLRSSEAFAEGHLIGAANVPNDTFDLISLRAAVGDLPLDAKIILYDTSGDLSDARAQELNGYGYANAKSLVGGLDYWQQTYGSQLIW